MTQFRTCSTCAGAGHDENFVECVDCEGEGVLDEQGFPRSYSNDDDAPDSPHDAMCHEYWDRGLNCPHIPKQEQERMRSALARGDDIDDVIDAGWGQFD